MKRNHRDLKAWQQAIELVTAVYALTNTFPKQELYGLTAQMRRAAVSVPANIAEGAARKSTKEYLHFLSIASGSLSELDTLVEVCAKLGYLNETGKLLAQLDGLAGLIMGLSASLKRKLDS